MKLSTFVINTGLLQVIGWSLVHFLWQGSILAMLLSGFLRLSRNLSSKVRYLVSCGAFGLMLLCPVSTFTYLAANAEGSSYTYAPSLQPQAGLLSLRSGWGYASSSLFASFAATANREMRWIVIIWCAGVLILLTHLVIGSIAVERLKTTSLISASDALQCIASQLGNRLKVSHRFRVFVSSAVAGPVVIGWLRPVILIPLASLSRLPVEQLEAILAHELAHINRHDYLVNTIQVIAEALLFYHPAVWWASRQIRREREHCCDDFAVMISGSPLSYAKALSLLEEQRASASHQLILGADGGHLAMRIKRILKQKEPSITLRGTALWLISIGMITIVALFSFSNLAATGAGAQSVQLPSHGTSTLLVSAKDRGRPDMKCTYYDARTQAHSGTCEAHNGDKENYYCAENEGEKQSQIQAGCKWKVQRLNEWESKQHQNE